MRENEREFQVVRSIGICDRKPREESALPHKYPPFHNSQQNEGWPTTMRYYTRDQIIVCCFACGCGYTLRGESFAEQKLFRADIIGYYSADSRRIVNRVLRVLLVSLCGWESLTGS